MAILSHDAQALVDAYLRQVTATLRGHTSVDADDIERDIQAHISDALAGQPEPVGAGSVKQILHRLGPPTKWAPADDLPSWRQALSKLCSGPGDRRLPYLTFVCFLAGPVLFLVPVERADGSPAGPLLWPLPVILPLASFVLARASLSVFAAQDESIAIHAWLLYPPLVLWYAALAIVVLAWPVAIVLAANGEYRFIRDWTGQLSLAPLWGNIALTAAVALGIWWMLLGLLIHLFRSAVRATFWPFAEWVSRRHALGSALTGFTIVAISGVVMLMIRR